MDELTGAAGFADLSDAGDTFIGALEAAELLAVPQVGESWVRRSPWQPLDRSDGNFPQAQRDERRAAPSRRRAIADRAEDRQTWNSSGIDPDVDWIQSRQSYSTHDGPMSTDRLNKLSLDRGAPPRTATQYVLEALRDGIATRKLEEGQQLVQNDIAETLNVSRMPVREALRILEAEGWVEFSPRRGAVVASLSVNDVPQIFEIRFALEALALRKSVPAVSSTILDRAASFLDDMDAESDIGRWVDLNRRFHLTLYAEAGARLLDLIESQYAAVDRYLRLELAEMHNADESQEEHRAILAACRAREVEEAVMLLEPHIYEAGIDLANALSKRRRTPE